MKLGRVIVVTIGCSWWFFIFVKKCYNFKEENKNNHMNSNVKAFLKGIILVFIVALVLEIGLFKIVETVNAKVAPLPPGQTSWTKSDCDKYLDDLIQKGKTTSGIDKGRYWDPKTSQCSVPPIKLPGITTGGFGSYFSSLYTFAVGMAGLLAVVMMMVGGLIWLTSAGSPEKVGQAKGYITGALTGLILVLCTYIILYTVNPALINLKSPSGITAITPAAVGMPGCLWSEVACSEPEGWVDSPEESCGSGSGAHCCCLECKQGSDQECKYDWECCGPGKPGPGGHPYPATMDQLICNQVNEFCMKPLGPYQKHCKRDEECDQTKTQAHPTPGKDPLHLKCNKSKHTCLFPAGPGEPCSEPGDCITGDCDFTDGVGGTIKSAGSWFLQKVTWGSHEVFHEGNCK